MGHLTSTLASTTSLAKNEDSIRGLQYLGFSMIKNKIWTSGPKFETYSRGIKRKARMSPLAIILYMGHAATHTGTNSYVGLSPGL